MVIGDFLIGKILKIRKMGVLREISPHAGNAIPIPSWLVKYTFTFLMLIHYLLRFCVPVYKSINETYSEDPFLQATLS